ncbi:LamB/YcsF family protein [Streptomyces sulphureus]|uniref:LamB/YcsF family protein n=1 Tax=Streptomyces sulphureus TaxID=47758 RepID=UPI000381D8F5|nr:5-oxoprolinase subunit PxpA [Streptomyces sulphureus]
MSRSIDLIADLGEGYGAWTMTEDDALTRIVSSANVACGFHAGDPSTIRESVALCVERGVAVGAHPSFPDLRGFGRRPIELPPSEIEADVLYQLGALEAFLRPRGHRLHHVLPHGSLGNMTVVREDYARAVARAVRAFDPHLTVVYQEGWMIRAAEEEGLPVARVGFPDRAYNDDGTLVRRALPGALVEDPHEVAERAVRMAVDGTVTTASGTTLRLACDSILVHGDGPSAVSTASTVRRRLESAGVEVAAWSGR